MRTSDLVSGLASGLVASCANEATWLEPKSRTLTDAGASSPAPGLAVRRSGPGSLGAPGPSCCAGPLLGRLGRSCCSLGWRRARPTWAAGAGPRLRRCESRPGRRVHCPDLPAALSPGAAALLPSLIYLMNVSLSVN